MWAVKCSELVEVWGTVFESARDFFELSELELLCIFICFRSLQFLLCMHDFGSSTRTHCAGVHVCVKVEIFNSFVDSNMP